ncbi:hypothetical protein F3Y22_tig00003551pilonHSYRG00013 [Hibiscus syriacus]|uniref:Uncharacterized protein n=1 Tax=Hibiscus syriacus TaxID=106335 RepID=A0A6A3CL39_HIBSY|nr:hypothetical protein F3Y22_tig00003551pilonHSYRG00013 [Hibiscus syriacus]
MQRENEPDIQRNGAIPGSFESERYDDPNPKHRNPGRKTRVHMLTPYVFPNPGRLVVKLRYPILQFTGVVRGGRRRHTRGHEASH